MLASLPFLAIALIGLVAIACMCILNSKLLLGSHARPTKVELSLIAFLLAIGLLAVYGRFYSGELSFSYTDLGSDTTEQYVPYYLNLLDNIREGTLGAWNHEYGLGSSFMSYQSWTLDPFNLILVPLGLLFGDSALAYILVAIQSLKIILCAFLFDWILCNYCKTPLARIFGSISFAFCGFLVMWGQHYWLGSVMVIATALITTLELMLQKWSVARFVATTGMVALSVIMSPQITGIARDAYRFTTEVIRESLLSQIVLRSA